MKLKFTLATGGSSRWVDTGWSDCFPGGFVKTSPAWLKTVNEIPVTLLPCSDLKQYGNETARGFLKLSPRRAANLPYGKDGTIMLDVRVCHRNGGARRNGTFTCYCDWDSQTL